MRKLYQEHSDNKVTFPHMDPGLKPETVFISDVQYSDRMFVINLFIVIKSFNINVNINKTQCDVLDLLIKSMRLICIQ